MGQAVPLPIRQDIENLPPTRLTRRPIWLDENIRQPLDVTARWSEQLYGGCGPVISNVLTNFPEPPAGFALSRRTW